MPLIELASVIAKANGLKKAAACMQKAAKLQEI